MRKIFWIAGEKSGDLHAGKVLEELQRRHPDWQHGGIGGPVMAEWGFQQLFQFDRFAVMGFIEVIKHLPFFFQVEKKIRQYFVENRPDLVVLVDYPGLNLRIARMANKLQIPVLYYICPQFWAWKSHRLLDLKRYTRHVANILPFETSLLQQAGIPSTYVGHPIAEEIEVKISREQFAERYNLNSNKRWLGFLPGSRNTEIHKMLPLYLETIAGLSPNDNEFLISHSSSVSASLFRKILQKYPGLNYHILEQDNYALMKYSDLVVVTSGTATLETAYLGTPFIIAYKANPLSFALGKRIVKIRRIGLPNIILDRDLASELIQNDATPHNLRCHITDILSDPATCRNFREELRLLHDLLGKNSASRGTAGIIEGLLHE